MYSIHPVVKRYAWGSYTHLQNMFASQLRTDSVSLSGEADRPYSDGGPIAEMWFSGHAQWPSAVDVNPQGLSGRLPRRATLPQSQSPLSDGFPEPGTAQNRQQTVAMPLTDLIRNDPEGMLGVRCSNKFGPVLPYLLKVISARIPLSLQVHPVDFQARAGFNAENINHVPIDAPERCFKDGVAKNEMVVALQPFEASVGFAAPTFMLSNLTLVDHPIARRMVEALTPQSHHGLYGLHGMRGVFGVTASEETRYFADADAMMPVASAVWQPSQKRIFRAFHTAVSAKSASGLRKALENAAVEIRDERSLLAFRFALAAEQAFPGDPSVLALLMMNPVSLQEGESVFIPAGTPHAYIHGTGVEIMNNSDNVLRAGMTVKHKDIPDFLRSLDCTSSLPIDPSVNWMGDLGTMLGNRLVYRPKIDEFMLSYGRVGTAQRPWPIVERLSLRYGRLMTKVAFTARHFGPRIVVCIEGTVRVTSSRESRVLRQGEAVFVPAADGLVHMDSDSEIGTFIMASSQI